MKSPSHSATEPRPRVVSVVTLGGFDERTILALAASLERGSTDHMAAAILEAAREQGIPLKRVISLCVVAGKGVTGFIGTHEVGIGNTALFAHLGISLGDFGDWAKTLSDQGQAVVLLAVNRRLSGLIGVVHDSNH